MVDQLARAQRIGHAHGGADYAGDRSDLLDHLVVCQRGKTQPAVLLGDDHPEEFVLLDEVPQRRRQIGMHMGDFPVIDLLAQGFHRAIEKGLFLAAELRLGVGQQLAPIGFATEQIALKSHRTGFQRNALGLRQGRQRLAQEAQRRGRDQRLADGWNQQQHRYRGSQGGQRNDRGVVGSQQVAGDQQAGCKCSPYRQPQAVIGGKGAGNQQGEDGQEDAHNGALLAQSIGRAEVAMASGNLYHTP